MVPINYYREIEPFAKYTDWCITIDELIFQQYGTNGNNRLYVAIRDDMSYVPAIPGSSSPHDDYGYSLMAIYVRRNGVSFYGLAFSHPESNIPGSVDILVTHEPPLAILHGIEGTNWGNLPLLKRIYDVKPKFHLFGHTFNLEQEPIIINI